MGAARALGRQRAARRAEEPSRATLAAPDARQARHVTVRPGRALEAQRCRFLAVPTGCH